VDKLKILGWAYTALSTIGLLGGAGLCVGLFFERDARGIAAYEFIFPLFLIVALVMLLPGLIGGIGLIFGRAWARIPTTIASLVLLFLFPAGTVIAVFAFWVLYEAERTAPMPVARPAASATPSPSMHAFNRIARQELSNATGILLAMAGVGAGFIVAIDGGFRFNRQPAPPPLDALFYPALVVLVLVVGYALRLLITRGIGTDIPRASSAWVNRGKLARERNAGEEQRRQRLARLAADPKTQKYARLIERGQAWSDEQIAYDLDRTRTATCIHLAPIEHAMRDTGLDVKFLIPAMVQSPCLIDEAELARKFAPLEPVRYVEYLSGERSIEDPPNAVLNCSVCKSTIRVVHRVEANLQTPLFPPPTS
jgi:hypothetical protein